jgi:hypothetical protein
MSSGREGLFANVTEVVETGPDDSRPGHSWGASSQRACVGVYFDWVVFLAEATAEPVDTSD